MVNSLCLLVTNDLDEINPGSEINLSRLGTINILSRASASLLALKQARAQSIDSPQAPNTASLVSLSLMAASCEPCGALTLAEGLVVSVGRLRPIPKL